MPLGTIPLGQPTTGGGPGWVLPGFGGGSKLYLVREHEKMNGTFNLRPVGTVQVLPQGQHPYIPPILEHAR